MQMQFVQIQLEVLLVLVNQNIQEQVLCAMVMIFFLKKKIELTRN